MLFILGQGWDMEELFHLKSGFLKSFPLGTHMNLWLSFQERCCRYTDEIVFEQLAIVGFQFLCQNILV